jgi:hypothetical protein
MSTPPAFPSFPPSVRGRPRRLSRLLLAAAVLCLLAATALALLYGRQREETQREQQVAMRAESILTRRSAHLLAVELVVTHNKLARSALEGDRPRPSPCSEVRDVAIDVSQLTGWTIRQVPIQPEAGGRRADWFEASAIRLFQRRPRTAYYGTYTTRGTTPRVYRYVLAQRAAPACLRCHAGGEDADAPRWDPDCQPGDLVCAVSVTLPEQKLLDHR